MRCSCKMLGTRLRDGPLFYTSLLQAVLTFWRVSFSTGNALEVVSRQNHDFCSKVKFNYLTFMTIVIQQHGGIYKLHLEQIALG